MPNKNLVWYAAYGSNLSYERFLCYLLGGKTQGCSKSHKGSRNKNLPLIDSPIILNHELFFARESNSWSGGGIAFINPERDKTLTTFGRIYLITKQQFEDVVKQENDLSGNVFFDLQKTKESGSITIQANSLYNKILFFGEIDTYPVFTITTSKVDIPLNKPSAEYLAIIIKGLKQTYNFDTAGICHYLLKMPGIAGEYCLEQLQELF